MSVCVCMHLRLHVCAFVCVQNMKRLDLFRRTWICVWMRLLFKDFWDVLYMYLDVGWMYGGHTLRKPQVHM